MKEEDLSNLIYGFLFKHKYRNENLGKMMGVQAHTISRWKHKRRYPTAERKEKMLSSIKSKGDSLEQLIELGMKVKNSLFFKGEFLDKNKAVSRSEMKGKLILRKSGEAFLNTFMLFPNSYEGKEIKFFLSNSKEFIVFYENQNMENPFPLKLPNLIKIDDNFLVGLGIWIAEGTKTNRKPKVTNSEPKIVKKSIEFFEHIGITQDKLNGWIQVHPRSEFSKNNKILKSFWLNITGFKNSQIANVVVKKDTSKIKRNKVKQMGTFQMECNLVLAKLLIKGLVQNTEKILCEVNGKELSFLQGLVAGEGWCGKSKWGSVNEITITLKDRRWRKLVLHLLGKFDLRVKENEIDNDITITGFDNFEKIHRLNLFEYLPPMKERFESGFRNLQENLIK